MPQAVRRLAVVVPTYNERANLPPLLDGLRAHLGMPYEVLVVDDNSPDGTADAAEALARYQRHPVRVLRRPRRAGLGSAYRAGFAAVRGPADAVVQMDADLSHDPADVPRLVAVVERGAGLAVASRYVPGGSVEGWGPWRKLVSRGANRLARTALSLPARDATSGFRCWAAAQAPLVEATRADGYAFQVETLHLAARRGVRVAEVPVRFVDRRRGASKLGAGEMAAFVATLARLRAHA